MKIGVNKTPINVNQSPQKIAERVYAFVWMDVGEVVSLVARDQTIPLTTGPF